MSDPASSDSSRGGDDGVGSNVVVAMPARGVALVTIDRASRLNTLSIATLEALESAFADLGVNDSIAAVVLTGAGGESFAAGADIREFSRLDSTGALAFAALGQRVYDRIERSPFAVIAAIDGFCMGGGLDLALSCDLRYATSRSTFAHPGARLGILTGFGGTARLTRTVGRANAIEMFATARRLSAVEALRVGIVDAVVEDARAKALEVAEQIASNASVATALEFKRLAMRARRAGPGR